MSYTPVAEAAKVIRTKLKAMGYGTKHVSVRSESYSMGSSIRVTIKDVTIALETIEAVANEQESIDRDGFGEILSGGNRFVFVEYDHKAMTEAAAPFIAEMPTDANPVTMVRGYEVQKEGYNDFVVITPVTGEQYCNAKRAYGPDGAARVIVRLLAGHAVQS